jgi:hypothetical protein
MLLPVDIDHQKFQQTHFIAIDFISFIAISPLMYDPQR